MMFFLLLVSLVFGGSVAHAQAYLSPDEKFRIICQNGYYERLGYGIWQSCPTGDPSVCYLLDPETEASLEKAREYFGKNLITTRELTKRTAELLGEKKSLCDPYPTAPKGEEFSF